MKKHPFILFTISILFTFVYNAATTTCEGADCMIPLDDKTEITHTCIYHCNCKHSIKQLSLKVPQEIYLQKCSPTELCMCEDLIPAITPAEFHVQHEKVQQQCLQLCAQDIHSTVFKRKSVSHTQHTKIEEDPNEVTEEVIIVEQYE